MSAADLRERVARAIAYQHSGPRVGPVTPSFYKMADAVLAELKPELQPQAEVERALQYLDRYLSAGLAAPDLAIHLASILTGGDGAGAFRDAAPQPQATDAAALAKRLDKALACHADSMPKEAYFEVDAVMRALNAAPQPQAASGIAAELRDEASRQHGNNYADELRDLLLRAAVAIDTATQPQPQALPDAMRTVTDAMRADPEYAWGWHCNIAMAFVDEGGEHGMANHAAARFMRLLAGVEPAHELPAKAAPQPQASPQASAEDLALVDEYLKGFTPFTGVFMAWQRIRASLMSATPTTGVGRE